MKIGIIGSGNIGSTVGELWAKAGHEVFFSSRHPEQLQALVQKIDSHAKAGNIEEAAKWGEVILLTIPLNAIPDVAKLIQPYVKNKIILDTNNPYPDRDGDIAVQVIKEGNGSGIWVAKHFPESTIVKAFNSVYFVTLRKEAHRKIDQIGIPLASNDKEALKTASQLVKDAGFEPVIVGDLATSKQFDVGTKPYNTGASARELRQLLGMN